MPAIDANQLLVLFGARLREARRQKGWKQSDLAAVTGLSQQYVSLIEAGQQNLTLGTLASLAAAVDREVWAMLRG